MAVPGSADLDRRLVQLCGAGRLRERQLQGHGVGEHLVRPPPLRGVLPVHRGVAPLQGTVAVGSPGLPRGDWLDVLAHSEQPLAGCHRGRGLDGLVRRPVRLPAPSHHAVGLRLRGGRHRLCSPGRAESDVRMDGRHHGHRHRRLGDPADQRGILQRQGPLSSDRTMAGVPPGHHRGTPDQRLRALAPTRHAVAVHLRPPRRWSGLDGLATPEHRVDGDDRVRGLDGRGEPL